MIFKKILNIQDELPAILKDKEFRQSGKFIYKFRGIDDLYKAVNPLFKKHRVFMTPKVLERESTEKVSSTGGTLFYEKIHVEYKIFAEDGSFVEATTVGIGMDSGDKAANKAMSVAQKYALIQIFSIPTEEPKDPEMDDHDVVSDEGLDEAIKEVLPLIAKATSREELGLIYNSYDDKPYHKNKAFVSVFVEAQKKLKGGGS